MEEGLRRCRLRDNRRIRPPERGRRRSPSPHRSTLRIIIRNNWMLCSTFNIISYDYCSVKSDLIYIVIAYLKASIPKILDFQCCYIRCNELRLNCVNDLLIVSKSILMNRIEKERAVAVCRYIIHTLLYGSDDCRF